MKPLGISKRILLTALAPATLVAVLVTGILVGGQIGQVRSEMHRRLEAVARQIATAAEFNIFTGNTEALRTQLDSALREPDLVAAAIVNPEGKLLAGTLAEAELPKSGEILNGFTPADYKEKIQHWHGMPIVISHVVEPDLFDSGASQPAKPLGQLLLKVSTESVQKETRRLLLVAGATSALILTFGALLALALSGDLIRVLGRIREVVDQVGHGIGLARVERTGHDELGQLAEGINRMADRVEFNRSELADKVRMATAALRKEKEDAEEAARARSRFFASASHDLRQPVQAMGLFTARLEAESQGSPLRPRVQLLARSVHTLQGLLDTLLDYSRLSGQVYRTEQRPVSATNAIASIVAEFAPTATEKGLDLRQHVADCWLLTDPPLLHRILINLVSNALRNTKRGGVLIACRRGATHARIEVWDTGSGIPPEKHTEIFEELVQLDNPERDASKGLGLGLAIVRRTAEILDHPLRLTSRPGRGSCFALTIPLTQAPDEIPGSRVDVANETATRILVRGEPSDDLRDITTLLDDWGYTPMRLFAHEEIVRRVMLLGVPTLLICATGGNLTATLDELDQLDATIGTPLPALLIHPGPLPHVETRSPVRRLLARPCRPARLRALVSHLLDPGTEMNSSVQE